MTVISLAPDRDTVYRVGLPPVLGIFQVSLTLVVPLTEMAFRSRTGPGVPVVTGISEALPVPAALLAVTLNLYELPSVNPVIMAVVPETTAVPPPVTA